MSTTEQETPVEYPTGVARFRDYLATDRGTPPPAFFEQTPPDADPPEVPVSIRRFTSWDWHDLEVERLWKRTWQVACRLNDIPNVGDRLSYDIAGIAIIVVRTGPDEVQAFHNSCRHRGNLLVEGSATGTEITCSFHGWSWNLDGSLRDIPCRWDMADVSDESLSLSKVAVGTWNGLVFVNMDPECESLEDFLGEDLMAQWEHWPHDRIWKAGHVARIVPCNWKIALEAFMESYHVAQVHPQTIPHLGDTNAQYDHYGPHARFITPIGVPSPGLGPDATEQSVVDAMIGDAFAMLAEDLPEGAELPPVPQVPEGSSARDVLSDFLRSSYLDRTGIDLGDKSDTEVLDAIEYLFFPNFAMWAGYSIPMYYRWRPNGDDPDSCIFEVALVVPIPEGQPIPQDAQLRILPPGENFADAPEVTGVGAIVDQDFVNLDKIQRGLHSSATGEVRYMRYQERNIRNFHAHLGAIVEPDG